MSFFDCSDRVGRRVLFLLLLPGLPAQAQPFRLPTANHALFERGGGEKFFVGTVGKPWTSGTFGCVRTEGWQMHEGLDIRSVQRDRRGEPTDPVMAAAEGTIAYINAKPSLSNYGIYIVLRHLVDGLEVYSTYAHLASIRSGLAIGHGVRAGEAIGILGRTTNTRETISKDRAHVHFELNLLINDRFPDWYKKHFPTQRNDHGIWNGQNLLALDPRLILLAQREQGTRFGLLNFLRSQNELCRVLVRDTDFPWVKRYDALIRRNPTAEQSGVAGYELALNFNGVPFELIPRAANEITGRDRFRLLSVNEAEYRRNPCRQLVRQRSGRWELASRGISLLELLTY